MTALSTRTSHPGRDAGRRCPEQEWNARAGAALAGGVSSNTRLLNPRSIIVERALGSKLYDVEGTEYIDYVLGQGPNFLGYGHPRIVAALAAAQGDGIVYAATHRREIEAAEAVLALLNRSGAGGDSAIAVDRWAETMRFGSSSSEMVQAAIRMARAATGRTKILRFHGHYHGWFDNINTRLVPGGAAPVGEGALAQALDDVVVIDWNDQAAFDRALAEHGDNLAMVIMEPIMLNAGSIIAGDGYVEAVRRHCTARGIVLVFDETISGFRVAVGGAVERLGVAPDLAVYGKAMAAGWPCAALVGRRALFEGVATGAVVHAGTFNGNVIAAAAVLACLDVIADGAVHAAIEGRGSRLQAGLEQISHDTGLGLSIQGLPMAFHARFAPAPGPATSYGDILAADAARYRRFAEALADVGVWIAARGIWYVSAAHDDEDVDVTLERVADIADTLN